MSSAGSVVARWVLMDCRARVSGALSLPKPEQTKGFKREEKVLHRPGKNGALRTNCVSASH